MEALRVRAAYGRTGQAPATFSSLRTYSPVGIGDGRPAFVPSNAGNANLGPNEAKRWSWASRWPFLTSDLMSISLTITDDQGRDPE